MTEPWSSFGNVSAAEASLVSGSAWYMADDESAGAASALDSSMGAPLSGESMPEGRPPLGPGLPSPCTEWLSGLTGAASASGKFGKALTVE